jgi:molybdopterin converting factor small subunit
MRSPKQQETWASSEPDMPDATMVTILVPYVLRTYCGGRSKLMLPAASVQAALVELEQHYPELYVCVCDETGAVRRHVNLFINDLHMRDKEGLKSRLAAGDVLSILPAVSGG